jgi:amino acid transporter
LSEVKAGAFIRPASGLRRNVTLFDATMLNVGWLTVGASIGILGFTMALFPTVSGVNLVYASLIGFVLVIPAVIVYTMMLPRMPRTGGDYVWMSRQLGMPLSSAIGFMLTAQIISFISIFVLSVVYTIGSVGLFFQPTSATFLGLALPGNVPGATPLAQLIVGGAIFVVLIILSTVAPKASYKIISALVLIGVASTVLAMGVLLSAGNAGIVNYMSSLGNSNMTYNALASSYSGPAFNLNNTMMLMPFLFLFIYPFMNASAISGSELKGKSAAKWSAIAGELIALALTTGAFATMYYVAGQAFINAAFSNPTAVFTYGINFWTLAMGAANNVALAWLLGICWILWNLAVVMVTIIVVSRYVFAQAFDRWLPSKLAYASRWGSPLYANLLNLVVGLALVAATVFLYGPLSSLTTLVIAPMLFFLFVGISAVLYGYKHEKGRSKATLMIAGSLMAIVFAYISVLTATLPSIYGGSTFTYSFLIVTCVIGVVLYYAYKAYYKSRGLDISLVYQQIPPL